MSAPDVRNAFSSAQEPLIAGDAITVRRDRYTLLDRVSVSVHPAEIVTLIGPNGAGKTTLVRALLGLIDIQEGSVIRAPGLTIGYVPQRLHIDRTFPLSVSRLMTLTNSGATLAAVSEALATAGVGALKDQPVSSLSGGEFQRVLLARALLRRPRLLVLDEPVQGVDFAGEAALYRLIGDIREELGCGVLMVSHDLHVVMAATDRVLCLNHHVCCSGSPDEVTADPEYSRLFGSATADAYALYRHHHDHTHAPDGSLKAVPGGGPSGRNSTDLDDAAHQAVEHHDG